MPAAAVIPAPIAYIKVVAVKASVVELRPLSRNFGPPCGIEFRCDGLRCARFSLFHLVTLSKLECFDQANA